MSKDATQTSSTRPDAKTDSWIDLWRKNIGAAQGQIGNNANIYGDVRSNIQSDFDRQRQMATLQGNDLATKAGAFGGNRSAVLNAGLQGDVNRQETSALSGLDLQQNQEQFQRLMALLGLQGQAAGVGGQTQTQTMPGNGLAGFGGLLATGLSFLNPATAGATVAGKLAGK